MGVVMDRDDAIRLATEYVRQSDDPALKATGAFETPEHWCVSFADAQGDPAASPPLWVSVEKQTSDVMKWPE